MMTSSVERARAAFARQAWGDAFTVYTGTAERPSLGRDDQERLAISAYLIGEDDEAAVRLGRRAPWTRDGRRPRGGRPLFVLAGSVLPSPGRDGAGRRMAHARPNGSSRPATRLRRRRLPADPRAARRARGRRPDRGRRHGGAERPRSVTASTIRIFGPSAGLGHGQALLARETPPRARRYLDEVMVSVTAGEVGPITSGIVYCAVVLECMRLFDLARATEWTRALSAWCDAQPDLVPYRGQCLVHRAQLQQAAGDWPDAITTIAVRVPASRRSPASGPRAGLLPAGRAASARRRLRRGRGRRTERPAAAATSRCPAWRCSSWGVATALAAAATIRRALQEVDDLLERPRVVGRGRRDLPGDRGCWPARASPPKSSR